MPPLPHVNECRGGTQDNSPAGPDGAPSVEDRRTPRWPSSVHSSIQAELAAGPWVLPVLLLPSRARHKSGSTCTSTTRSGGPRRLSRVQEATSWLRERSGHAYTTSQSEMTLAAGPDRRKSCSRHPRPSVNSTSAPLAALRNARHRESRARNVAVIAPTLRPASPPPPRFPAQPPLQWAPSPDRPYARAAASHGWLLRWQSRLPVGTARVRSGSNVVRKNWEPEPMFIHDLGAIPA